MTLPAGTAGSEIAVLIERIQGGSEATVDGAAGEAAADLYLGRRRVMRRWSPANDVFTVSNLNLSAPRRVGSILAWRTSSEVEIAGDLIATYPFAASLAPRLSAESAESGDEAVHVIGEEPKLSLSMALYSSDVSDPAPDQKIFEMMRALSPQKNFFFFGRNLSEAWIIGSSSRRSVKSVASSYAKQTVQPVNMEVL